MILNKAGSTFTPSPVVIVDNQRLTRLPDRPQPCLRRKPPALNSLHTPTQSRILAPTKMKPWVVYPLPSARYGVCKILSPFG
jgi:hypothetical protein